MADGTVHTALSVGNDLQAVVQASTKTADDLVAKIAGLTKDLGTLGGMKPLKGAAVEIADLSKAFDHAKLAAGNFHVVYGSIGADTAHLTSAVTQVNALEHSLTRATEAQGKLDKSMAAMPNEPAEHKSRFGALKEQFETAEPLGEAGRKMFEFMTDAVKPAMEERRQVELLRLQGMSHEEIEKAEEAAWKDRIAGTTTTQALQVIGELHNQHLTTDQATALMPEILKFQKTMEITTGSTPEHLADVTLGVLQSLGWTTNPQTHENDPQRTQAGIDLLTRIAISTNGKLGPQQLGDFVSAAGSIGAGLDEKGLRNLVPFIQSMPSAKEAGAALSSLNLQIAGGVMPEAVARQWDDLGLLDRSKVKKTKDGEKLAPGAVLGEALWKENPVAWIQEKLIPAMKEKHLTSDQQQDMILRLMNQPGGQSAAAGMARSLLDVTTFNQQIDATLGAKSADDIIANNPKAAFDAFTVELEEFKTAIGEAILPVVLPALHRLTEGLMAVSAWAHDEKNAGWLKLIIGLAAFAGVFMVVIGVIASVVGAIGTLIAVLGAPIVLVVGVVIAAIIALVGALLVLGPDGLWKVISDALTDAWSWLVDWFTGLGPIMKGVVIALGIALLPILWPILLIGAAIVGVIYLITHWHEVWGWVWRSFGAAVDWVKAKFLAYVDWVRTTTGAVIEWVKAKFHAYVEFIRTLPNALNGLILRVGKLIADFGTTCWTAFQSALSDLVKRVIAFVKSIPDRVYGAVTGSPKTGDATKDAALEAMSKASQNPFLFNLGANLGNWLFGSDQEAQLAVPAAPTIQGGPAPSRSLAATDAVAAGDSAGGDARASPVNIHVQPSQAVFQLDGRTIATAVMDFLARQVGGPNTGTADFPLSGAHAPAGVPIGMQW